jgi:hypothetical protein
LNEEDWERADMYAKLVRSFMIHGPKGPKIEQLTYYQIQASRRSRALFPNLREMYCYGRWEEVCFILSPSLRRVVILEEETYHPPSLSISTLVDALPKICPDIQSLEAYVDLSSSALRSIHKLQKLQYLGLDFLEPRLINIEHIIGISLLPNLRWLQFSMPRWSDRELQKLKYPPISYPPEAFRALQRLDFCASLDSIVNALPSLISPNLTTFTVEIQDIWVGGDFEFPERLCYKLCDILVKHARSPSSTLRSFIFIGNCSRCSDISPTGADAFQPLLALPQLETLVFNMHLDEFDDQSLIKWATAWSNLKIFKMKSSNRDPIMITLSGIKTLLQLCRNLKNLTLSFDASKLDLIPEIPSTTPSLCHGLKDWDISVSRVTPATLGPVMAVLSWVFLDVSDVKSCMGSTDVSEVLPQSLERIATNVY